MYQHVISDPITAPTQLNNKLNYFWFYFILFQALLLAFLGGGFNNVLNVNNNNNKYNPRALPCLFPTWSLPSMGTLTFNTDLLHMEMYRERGGDFCKWYNKYDKKYSGEKGPCRRNGLLDCKNFSVTTTIITTTTTITTTCPAAKPSETKIFYN